jgi:hypothetical protein
MVISADIVLAESLFFPSSLPLVKQTEKRSGFGWREQVVEPSCSVSLRGFTSLL